ncbi:type II toxin-antitoxin system RelE/ParE family toxin [uncultured Sphingomonas sp.]|uniref:type II toxin-antitoxin system RelE/ParE family toxin n=1 Tax=uncultured Sphingomonas sp. TaxID=158754 RepID=UPI0035C948C7
MARVIWEPSSFDDLEQIIDYIDRYDPEAALGIAKRLFLLGESLAEFPARGRPCDDGFREMTTVRPYILRYVLGDDVRILSIRHSARGPLD